MLRCRSLCQAPVRAAIHGRVLLIDGIERAERNVLPTLNNLLENREMGLDDGRFLVSPATYACLPASQLCTTHGRMYVYVYCMCMCMCLCMYVPGTMRWLRKARRKKSWRGVSW